MKILNSSPLLILAAFITFWGAAVHAQPQAKEALVRGAGSELCSQWIEVRLAEGKSPQGETAPALASYSWVSGFLSGLNVMVLYADRKAKTVNLPNPAISNQMLDKECRDDPSVSVSIAAMMVYLHLKKDQSN